MLFYVEVLVNVLIDLLGLKTIDNDFDDDVGWNMTEKNNWIFNVILENLIRY